MSLMIITQNFAPIVLVDIALELQSSEMYVVHLDRRFSSVIFYNIRELYAAFQHSHAIHRKKYSNTIKYNHEELFSGIQRTLKFSLVFKNICLNFGVIFNPNMCASIPKISFPCTFFTLNFQEFN